MSSGVPRPQRPRTAHNFPGRDLASSSHAGGGRPEHQWRVSPSNTHPAPRPPLGPAASPWPRRAAGAQSAATGDGARRRLARAPGAGAAAAAGGARPPAPVTAGGPAPGPGERASPLRGGRLGMLRALAPQGASRLRRPLPDSGRSFGARCRAPGAGARTKGSCALQRRPGREEGVKRGRREREGAG